MSATVRLSLKAAKELMSRCSQGDSPALRELEAAIAKASRASATRRTLRKPKRAKQKAKREARVELKQALWHRCGGKCEACGFATTSYLLDVDHFFGRARAESVETCWAVCRACHREKTNNRPNAAFWLAVFAIHCDKHGYSEAEARARKRLAWVELRDSQAGGGAP